jgi:hypothetical protein
VRQNQKPGHSEPIQKRRIAMIKKANMHFETGLRKAIDADSSLPKALGFKKAMLLPAEILALQFFIPDWSPSCDTPHSKDILRKYFHNEWHEGEVLSEALQKSSRMQVVYNFVQGMMGVKILLYEAGKKNAIFSLVMYFDPPNGQLYLH